MPRRAGMRAFPDPVAPPDGPPVRSFAGAGWTGLPCLMSTLAQATRPAP